MTKNFSNHNIYIAGGDLTKRWYVYFSYRNPETGKLKRVTPIYGNVNKFKTKEERLYVLSAYRKKLLKILKAGFNPFEDNEDLYQKYKSKEGTLREIAGQKEDQAAESSGRLYNHFSIKGLKKFVPSKIDTQVLLRSGLII